MNENFIEDILKITNSKVFCLGDLMLDKYVIGSTNRISPEGPIPGPGNSISPYLSSGFSFQPRNSLYLFISSEFDRNYSSVNV